MKQSIYWHETLQPAIAPPLRGDTTAEAVVVGGGMAGLTLAQWLREEADLDTVLLEAEHCGAGATGHNSGAFLPDAFHDVDQLLRRLGDEDGSRLARASVEAARHVRASIDRYGIDCDLTDVGVLFAASGALLPHDVKKEHAARLRAGLQSQLYAQAEIPALLGSEGYTSAIGYPDGIGLNGYKYTLGLRDALIERGLRVFEQTPVKQVHPDRVVSSEGEVRARHVFVCTDRFASNMGIKPDDLFHQQHFITVSEPLSAELQQALFPSGPLLVHALGRLFHYYRLTPDGRLVIGATLLRKAYAAQGRDAEAEVETLLGYMRQLFPALRQVKFTHGWSGLFGLTRDLFPLAGPSNGVHLALSAGSMAWSVLAAQTAAQQAIEGEAPLHRFFQPQRAYTPLDPLIAPLGKRLSFPLANLYATSVLQGPPERVARQQRYLRLGAGGLLFAGALAGARYLLNRSSR